MHNSVNILTQIVEKRKIDISESGLTFGISIPEKRTREVHPFLKTKGVILEVKRASPSKGDIKADLDSYETALSYANCGAGAISCLTEKNYFKGTLEDLMNVCRAADDYEKQNAQSGIKVISPAVLRKDFLLYSEEIEVSYRAGADAVLLIARILDEKTIFKMAEEVVRLKMSALIEIREESDLKKIKKIVKKLPSENFVYGINSRDLATFKIDLLRPCLMVNKIKKIAGDDARIIFESGVKNPECAFSAGSMGFSGLLLGEAAAKNPEIRKNLVASFLSAVHTDNAVFWNEYASEYALEYMPNGTSKTKVKICGITRIEDAELADKLGSSFLGFIFADAFPRSITRDNRLEKILPHLKKLKAKKIAVITNLDSKESLLAFKLVREKVFDAIQFHKIKYENVSKELLSLPHYFATDSLEEYEKLISKGELRVLLDSKQIRNSAPESLNDCKWLAGGINERNISDVIKKFSPELIDISSGIELENKIGIKDKNKMKELFKKRSLK